MKKPFTLLFVVLLCASPAGWESVHAQLRNTQRTVAGVAYNGFIYTRSGWVTHTCVGPFQFNVPNGSGFHTRGIYGRCLHGIVYVSIGASPSGVFPRPGPPLPPIPIPRPPASTNGVPPRPIRVETVSMFGAQRIRGGARVPVPPPLPPSLITTNAPPVPAVSP